MGKTVGLCCGVLVVWQAVVPVLADSVPRPSGSGTIATTASPEVPELLERIDAALARAGNFLVEKQESDGAWRSDVYGALRDGPSLTPYVLSALYFLPETGVKGRQAFDRGVEYLIDFVDGEGRLKIEPRELLFPVYTAASASRVIALRERDDRHLNAQAAWLGYLRQRQLTEALGWRPEEPEYGGWGYSLDLPHRPAAGKPKDFFCESNLSATVFGLAALKSARVPEADLAYSQALTFVKRCQNYPESPDNADPKFDDGGFFFLPGDAVQNKAGIAGVDRFDRQRFRSYGTMTADGLRALLRCGLSYDHPRVVAARDWLVRNFSAETNPGEFPSDRAVLQDATYYYWTWAVAHAFLALEMERGQEANSHSCPIAAATSSSGDVPSWTRPLAEELLRRQRPDGTWGNRYTDAKEDDPLVATPWAAAALAIAKRVLRPKGRRVRLDAQ